MIRKFAHLAAPRQRAQEILGDIAEWPQWLPGVRSVEILERGRDRLRVDVRQKVRGWALDQVLELRYRADGFSQHQISGRLRRWDLNWRFFAPPDGGGTTLALEIDFDLGLMGLLMPARMLQRTIDQLFGEVASAAEGHLAEVLAAESAPAVAEGPPMVEIFETPEGGLEVWLDGRRYALRAVGGER